MQRTPFGIERNRISYLVIELSREICRSISAAGALGRDYDKVLVACAVSIGHTERRPLTAAKIALFLEMPRTTVLRKLDELEALGIVQRQDSAYTLSTQRVSLPDDHISRITRILLKFALPDEPSVVSRVA